MASYQAPQEWEDQVQWLAQSLHGRSSWRLSVLLLGALFANGRRVVASWIRAAGVSHDFQDFDFFLQSVGPKWKELGGRLLILLLPILKDQLRVLLAVVLRHQRWGTIGLPIFSWLSVRQQDVAKIPKWYGWTFQTKLQQAADLRSSKCSTM